MNDNNENGWMEKVKGVEAPRDLVPAPVLPTEALGKSAVTDATRVMSETQAMIMLARSKPRKYVDIRRSVEDACSRVRFAEKSCYRFPRGNSEVTGPSIRLMEALVIAMTNIDAGWRVLDMEDDRARVEAFAWDLENNTRKRIEFWVPLVRDTKAGPRPLTSERDKYEVMASAAQRRVRACIQNIIPFDIIEDAMDMCAKTIANGDGTIPIKERIARMVIGFEKIGVNQAMLEENLGHPIDAIVTGELPRMREIYNAIKDGHARREEFFNVFAGEKKPDSENKEEGSAKDEEKPKNHPNKAEPETPPAPSEQPPTEDPAPDPAPKTEVVTKPAEQKSETPKLDSILLKRLRENHGMTDDEISGYLGGPIKGAPTEELERILEEADKRAELKKKRGGKKKDSQKNNGNQGDLPLADDKADDAGDF